MRRVVLHPVVLIAVFLVLRAAMFSVTTAGEFALYRDYALQARKTSLSEFYRTRDIEYPPVATLFGVAVLYVEDALPAGIERLTVWRPEPTRGIEWARYEVALGLVLLAVDVACLALVYALARRIYPNENPLKRAAIYVAATTALGLIFFDRQDPVVALVAVTAVATFVRGWSVAAYAVLAIGIAYKLVPVLLVPVWVFAFASAGSRGFIRGIVRESIVAGALLALVPILMYLFAGGERAFGFLTFHAARGLQLEATPVWPVLLIEPGTEVGHSFGSFTLRGGLADAVARATTPLTAVATILSVLLAVRGFRRATGRNELAVHLVASSLLVWLAFIVCTKVGSPQYLLWLTGLVALMPLCGAGRWWVALLLAGMGVTTLVYPCFYRDVVGQKFGDDLRWAGPTGFTFALLVLKSALLTAAFAWLAVLVWRGPWLTGTTERMVATRAAGRTRGD